MEPLDLQSETFPPTGGVASEGVQNQLGRARLDRLSLLVREAVQNSWDAGAGNGPVLFSLDSWVLAPPQLAVLRDRVFRQRAPATGITEVLEAGEVRVLAIQDGGTVGLGGPTRADIEGPDDDATDFVDFMRNVGQPPDHERGGGTYGFGKAAYYLASSVRAICVYTRCRYRGAEESRFMAACLGPHFTWDEGGTRRRYTGRHWWGIEADDGIVEPVVGSQADEIAEALGVSRYRPGAFGTTVLVIAPELEDGAQPLSAAVTTLLRDFWPKLMDGPQGGGTMVFEVRSDGERIEVPHPEGVPALAGFCQAFRVLADAGGGEANVTNIECRNPKQELGRLALVGFPPPAETGWPPGSAEDQEESPWGEVCRHVALLRAPNFVVRYLPGPPVPFDQMAYAGVFKVLDDVDRVFANAEPPTHDDWIPDMLDRRHDRTFVRMAFRRIGEALRAFAAPPQPEASDAEEVPLGAFSHALGGLIPGEPGIGAAVPAGGVEGAGRATPAGDGSAGGDSAGRSSTGAAGDIGSAGSGGGAGSAGGAGAANAGARRVRVQATGPARLEVVGGRPALVVPYAAEGPDGATVRIGAEGWVVVEGSAIEREPPAGADRPQVVEWRDADGRVAAGAAERAVRLANRRTEGVVAVSIPSDSMIRVRLTAKLAGDHD